MISISKFFPVLSAGVATIAIAVAPMSGVVAQEGNKNSIELPADPEAWLNSPPISNEVLKGKAAILYFFEEG